MSRRAARGLYLALILVGALLYLVFVLPRWWVLTGDIPFGLATAGRLAAGIPIALAALPVFAILRDSLARKAAVPELALRLRAWSGVLHVVAGGLILVSAIVEIWLRLGVGGRYLFAVYGAAASIAILAVLAFYLSFVAEKPPAEPKPPKVKKVKAEKKKDKKPRGKKRSTTAEAVEETADAETSEAVVESVETSEATVETEEITEAVIDETSETTEVAVETVDTIDTDGEAVEAVVVTDIEEIEEGAEIAAESSEAAPTGLRNKRPSGKRRRLLGR